ncbi:MAG: IS200/IS605 family element transposase accessory protein TnpB [Methanosarcinales archaeon]|nr:IS200/IS605 family element transposase accessory protein TnpB [Methanosarcinales archaeon]
MNTAYKFRMYPTKQQEAQLDLTLETCRYLYNLALADRKSAYEVEGISRSYEDQAAMLTVERKNGNFNGVYAHCLQDVLRRLDKSFKAFFRRVKAGEKPGYPRFKGQGWYKSFTYPDSETGYKIEGSKLTLSKIGSIRIFKHREVEGKIKTCSVKKDKLGHWYAILVTEIGDVPQIEPKTVVGVDVGLKNLVALSTGETIQYPRYYIKTEKQLAAAQRSKDRKKKGSKNRAKAKIKEAKISQRVTNLRDEFLHQVSRKLVDSADLIVFEDLNIQGMLKNHHLAKHIQDHAWGKLIQFTQSKAEKAGKIVELVDARYTSQKCSQCGTIVPKTLAIRVHRCPNCGLEMDRDINASVNISTLGLRGRAYRDTVIADR